MSLLLNNRKHLRKIDDDGVDRIAAERVAFEEHIAETLKTGHLPTTINIHDENFKLFDEDELIILFNEDDLIIFLRDDDNLIVF